MAGVILLGTNVLVDFFRGLRLVGDGFNDSRHPTPFQEETFGRKGLRIGGKTTTGNIRFIGFNTQCNNQNMMWQFLEDSSEGI